MKLRSFFSSIAAALGDLCDEFGSASTNSSNSEQSGPRVEFSAGLVTGPRLDLTTGKFEILPSFEIGPHIKF